MRGLLSLQRRLMEFGFGQRFAGERLKRSDPALGGFWAFVVMDTFTATIMTAVATEIAVALMTAATFKATATTSTIRTAATARESRLIMIEILPLRIGFRWLRSLDLLMNCFGGGSDWLCAWSFRGVLGQIFRGRQRGLVYLMARFARLRGLFEMRERTGLRYFGFNRRMMLRRRKRFARQENRFKRFSRTTLLGRFIRAVRSILGLRQFAAIASVTAALAPAAPLPAAPTAPAIASTAITATKIAAAPSAGKWARRVVSARVIGRRFSAAFPSAAKALPGQRRNLRFSSLRNRRFSRLLGLPVRTRRRRAMIFRVLIHVFNFLEEIADVEEGVAIEANVDKGRLHAGKHACDSPFVDAAD